MCFDQSSNLSSSSSCITSLLPYDNFNEPETFHKSWLLLLRYLKKDLATLVCKQQQGLIFLICYLLSFVAWMQDQNTSADFISFYEELLPYAQTRQLIKLHIELIFSKLVSELQMEARFSLDSILRFATFFLAHSLMIRPSGSLFGSCLSVSLHCI